MLVSVRRFTQQAERCLLELGELSQTLAGRPHLAQPPHVLGAEVDRRIHVVSFGRHGVSLGQVASGDAQE